MKISDFLKIVLSLGFFCFSVSALGNSEQQPTEVACRYEMKVTPHAGGLVPPSNHAWFFWRKPGMIQTQDAGGDYGEIWEQTSNGGIHYRKLYHADKTAVEYMPADMPANNMHFDWFKLSSMLSRQELDALKPVKKTQVFGRNAELRRGKTGDQNMEVLWLPDENLPARILRKNKTGRVELRLLEISRLQAARWQPVDVEDLADYRHIDAADFGDLENDPFVKKVMAAEGHRH